MLPGLTHKFVFYSNSLNWRCNQTPSKIDRTLSAHYDATVSPIYIKAQLIFVIKFLVKW